MKAEIFLQNFTPENDAFPKKILDELKYAKILVMDRTEDGINFDPNLDGEKFFLCVEYGLSDKQLLYEVSLEDLEYFAHCLKGMCKTIRRNEKK